MVHFNILLADDDEDDCILFEEALKELSSPALLQTVSNGVELMNFLKNKENDLPHMLFLDLNMPLKSGSECLTEISKDVRLKQLPIIIYSTSSNPEEMQTLYDKGAQYYIRKPADFANLKSVIKKAIALTQQNRSLQPTKEKFVIQP